MEIVEKYQNKPWDWNGLSCNQNITSGCSFNHECRSILDKSVGMIILGFGLRTIVIVVDIKYIFIFFK